MPEDEKIIYTRSGVVIIRSDATVLKKHDIYSNAEKEFEVLEKLYRSLPKAVEHKGWFYKTIKPINYDGAGNIVMEKAPGNSLVDIYLNEPQMSYHAGVWLAIFHNYNRCKTIGEVAIFSDYGAPHVFIDRERYTVTAIDPGFGFGQKGGPEHDVLSFAVGAITLALKNLRLPLKLLYPFLNGYYSITRIPYNQERFKAAVKKVFDKYRMRWAKQPGYKKLALIIYWPYLHYYCNFKIKKIIKSSMRRV